MLYILAHVKNFNNDSYDMDCGICTLSTIALQVNRKNKKITFFSWSQLHVAPIGGATDMTVTETLNNITNTNNWHGILLHFFTVYETDFKTREDYW